MAKDHADTPKPPSPKKKIAALVVVYLNALQQSPGLSEAEYKEAETLKNRIATDAGL